MTTKKTALAKSTAPELVSFSAEQVNLLQRTIAAEATHDELALFVGQCKRTGLDPFTRQIYFMKAKRPDRSGNRKVTIMVSIDGFRLIASRSGQYAGQTPTQWCGKDGVWKDVWLEDAPPAAARVGVLRHDFKEPLYAVALYAEAVQMVDVWENNQKTGQRVPNEQWKTRGAHMLGKVAEALALRKAFPNDLSGLYTSDEIAEDHGPVQATNAAVTPSPDAKAAPAVRGEVVEGEVVDRKKPAAADNAKIEVVRNLKRLGYPCATAEECAAGVLKATGLPLGEAPLAEIVKALADAKPAEPPAASTGNAAPGAAKAPVAGREAPKAATAPPKPHEKPKRGVTEVIAEYRRNIDRCATEAEVDEVVGSAEIDPDVTVVMKSVIAGNGKARKAEIREEARETEEVYSAGGDVIDLVEVSKSIT